MATFRRKRDGFTFISHGILFFANGGSGFERNTNDDVLAVGNAALHAARSIGDGANGAAIVRI